MLKGVVIGEVWATKKVPFLDGKKLKLIGITNENGFTRSGRVIVAIDILDSEIGNNVMISLGSGARNVLKPGSNENYEIATDSAISMIIDMEE